MTRAAMIVGALAAATALSACGGSGAATSSHTAAAPSTRHTAATATSTAATSAGAIRFASVPLTVPSGMGASPFDQTRSLRLPRGWHASVWARVDGARMETWTPDGTLLVSTPGAGSVVELTPRKNGAPAQKTVVSGLTDPQGMAFDRVGGREVLYVAASNEVVRYDWSHGGVSAPTVLIPNLPDTQPAQDDVHRLKNVVVGPNHVLYVTVGSSSNASPRTSWHGTPRATIMAYRPNGSRLRVWATGVRNGEGLSFAPDGTLWTAVNERDQIPYPFHRAYGSGGDAYGKVITAYVNEHPPDELARLTAGRDLGWPYCNPDPDVHRGSAGTSLDDGDMPFDDDTVTNPGGRTMDCAKLSPIQRGLPAHSAPLGFHFLQGSKLPARWAAGAVVAAHGSWDRQPPRAPAIYWMAWNAKAKTLGAAITIVGGFQDANGSRWGRPADAVAGPDGALYVSDDQAGAIYRIVP